MSTKRKLPRRKLPWISNLLDHLPYSKLPTKLVVLQRLFFEIESGYPLSLALSTVQQELKALWAYAGYEDILMSNSNLVVEIRKLHKSYKDLLKFNVAKRELPRFKKKEELFLDQLPVLFNITVKSLIPSNLITAEDRSYLLHNWDKTISSTLDVTTKQAVEKKLVRHEKSRKFTSAHSSNPSSSSVASPEVVLFKVLRKTWDSLDLQNIQLPDRIPAVYRGKVDPLQAFIDNRLDPANRDLLPRCDYNEYLELAKLFLGGSITREKGYVYSIQRPGADHHARWMSKAIYILKMSLVQHQIPALHWTQKKKVAKMALFVVFVYLEAWFSATVLVSAASNDLAFHKRADSFKAVDKKVSRSATKVLNRHTWYLTEELIALTIFDEGLSKETRDLIAAKIGNLDVEEFEIKKPSLPTITAATAVSDFVGPRSRLVFDLLEVPTNFLLEEDWQLQPEYSTTKRILETFTPVNDSTERALALATNYNSKITRNEESYQELLLVVEEHRKTFVITTKADLLNLY